MVGGHMVEQRAGRVALLGKRVLVIARADNPLSRGHAVVRDKPRQRLLDFREIHRFPERRLQHRIRRAGKMAVRVEKRRQQDTAVQIDLRGIARPRVQPLIGAHRGDHTVFHQQCFGLPIRFHRVDRAAVIQRFHTVSLFSATFGFSISRKTQNN